MNLAIICTSIPAIRALLSHYMPVMFRRDFGRLSGAQSRQEGSEMSSNRMSGLPMTNIGSSDVCKKDPSWRTVDVDV